MRVVGSLSAVAAAYGSATAQIIGLRRENERKLCARGIGAAVRRDSDGALGKVTAICPGDEPDYVVHFEDGSCETHDFNSLEQLEVVG